MMNCPPVEGSKRMVGKHCLNGKQRLNYELVIRVSHRCLEALAGCLNFASQFGINPMQNKFYLSTN